MSQTKYNVVFPLAKKDEYLANDTVDFILSLENKKLVPGSLAICGECAVLSNVSSDTAVTQTQDINMDPDAGYHSLFRDMVTEFRDVGITESFSYYPRLVKMKTQATFLRDSLGTQTFNSIEGKTLSKTVRQGYNLGVSATDPKIPFVLKPDIAPNKSDMPIPGNQVGVIRIRTRLAPNDEVLFGNDVSADAGYKITNLQIRYETVNDDGSRPDLNMEVYNVIRQVIETNNANLSSFVPGLNNAVHMSFLPVADETTKQPAANFLRCATVPGDALLPDSVAGNNGLGMPNNGFQRLYFAVNDTDTALVGFTMEDRNEILHNYLRSFNNTPNQYSTILQRVNEGDAYGIGINFGGPLDFTRAKFAAEVDSQIAEPYSCYMYFRGSVMLPGSGAMPGASAPTGAQ